MSITMQTDKEIEYSAAGFVLNNERKILFVQEYGYYWGLPRGRIEAGETPIQAARREIREETGVEMLELLGELGSYQRSTFGKDGLSDNRLKKDIKVFLFRATDTNIKPNDPAITDAKWLEPEDALNLLINEADKEFFEKCLADERTKSIL